LDHTRKRKIQSEKVSSFGGAARPIIQNSIEIGVRKIGRMREEGERKGTTEGKKKLARQRAYREIQKPKLLPVECGPPRKIEYNEKAVS